MSLRELLILYMVHILTIHVVMPTHHRVPYPLWYRNPLPRSSISELFVPCHIGTYCDNHPSQSPSWLVTWEAVVMVTVTEPTNLPSWRLIKKPFTPCHHIRTCCHDNVPRNKKMQKRQVRCMGNGVLILCTVHGLSHGNLLSWRHVTEPFISCYMGTCCHNDMSPNPSCLATWEHIVIMTRQRALHPLQYGNLRL